MSLCYADHPKTWSIWNTLLDGDPYRTLFECRGLPATPWIAEFIELIGSFKRMWALSENYILFKNLSPSIFFKNPRHRATVFSISVSANCCWIWIRLGLSLRSLIIICCIEDWEIPCSWILHQKDLHGLWPTDPWTLMIFLGVRFVIKWCNGYQAWILGRLWWCNS